MATDDRSPRRRPDELPESYINADPNEGFDPYTEDTRAGVDHQNAPLTSRVSYGARLARENADDILDVLCTFKTSNKSYFKTRDFAPELGMTTKRAARMMRWLEAHGWIEAWKQNHPMTWYIALDPDDPPDPRDLNNDPPGDDGPHTPDSPADPHPETDTEADNGD